MIQDIQPGFYAEGKAEAASPLPYDIVYVSGKVEKGRNTLSNLPADAIMGEKFTHKLSISVGEWRDFYELSKDTLDRLLERDNLPDGFTEWFKTRQESLSAK